MRSAPRCKPPSVPIRSSDVECVGRSNGSGTRSCSGRIYDENAGFVRQRSAIRRQHPERTEARRAAYAARDSLFMRSSRSSISCISRVFCTAAALEHIVDARLDFDEIERLADKILQRLATRAVGPGLGGDHEDQKMTVFVDTSGLPSPESIDAGICKSSRIRSSGSCEAASQTCGDSGRGNAARAALRSNRSSSMTLAAISSTIRMWAFRTSDSAIITLVPV